MNNAMASPNYSSLSSDKPDTNPDAFHRGGFVQSLGKLLCLSPTASSTVVGLEGKWGSGKSFCIKMLEKELKTSPHKPVILHYDPWILSNIDSLVEGFFTQLGSELGAKSGKSIKLKKASQKFIHVGNALSVLKCVPRSEPWISLIQNGLGQAGTTCEALSELFSMDLREQFIELHKSILAINKPVIVIIDDLDRLQPDQVRLVFQLVKTVGDLPRVAYLMAYDRDSVVKALHSANIHDGEAYLEKMVQLPVHLPRQALVHKKPFLEEAIRNVLCQMDITLSKKDETLLLEAITDTDLLLTIETPRDVVRICNGLRMHLTVLGDEVCFADLLLLETIHVRMPKLYDMIQNNHQTFINPYDINIETKTIFGEIGAMTRAMEKRHSDKEDSRFSQVINDSALKSYNRAQIQSLLLTVFPALTPHHDEVETDPRRLRHPDALYKVLQVGIMDFTFNRETALAFLQDTTIRGLMLKDAVEHQSYNDLLLSTAQWIQHLTVADIHGLYQLLDSTSRNDFKGNYDVDPHRVTADFLKRCILTATPEEAKVNLQRILQDEQNLVLTGLLLRDILEEYFLWENTTGTYEEIRKDDVRKSSISSLPLSYEDVFTTKDIWIDTVSQAKNHRDIFVERGAPFILYFSSQLKKSKLDILQEMTASTMSTPNSLIEFLKNFSTYKELRNEIKSYFPDLKELHNHLESFNSNDAIVTGWMQAIHEMIPPRNEDNSETDN